VKLIKLIHEKSVNMEMETVEAKRMRLDENLRSVRIQNEKLDLKIYQNHLKTQCIEDNYINK
jgi:hypothetical protein